MRTTISNECTFEGPGLHTGTPSHIALHPLRERRGILFRFEDGDYAITEARRTDAQRNTTIAFPNGRTIATVEHLLSAIVGIGVDDVVVECRGSEMPILDGSAFPYAERILRTGIEEKDDPSAPFYVTTPVCVDDGPSTIAAVPSDVLRVTYVIDYPGTSIGTEMRDLVLTKETFLAEIAPARTFALRSEIEALRASGLAMGGTLDNALIVGDDGPVGNVALRVESEYAAHKILDLIGDLALLGTLPTAHYICIKGGHSLHCKLVNRIRGTGVLPRESEGGRLSG